MCALSEIVTIQAGNFANFIGTHWWNLQEESFSYDPLNPSEIDHDVLFREGLNYKGEVTFTPRLVLIDLKSNVRSIRQECPLYRLPDDESNPLWQGPVEVVKEAPVRKNPFLEEQKITDITEADGRADEPSDVTYDFNSPTTVWSDFLKTNLHPRSFCLFQEVSSEDKNPLEIYSSGDEIYKRNGTEMVEDTLRKMTEECDRLQGFQLIYDCYNGFSGIINHVLQHLNDEYSRHPTLCFPTFQSNKTFPYKDVKEQMHRLYAVLLSLSSMTSNSSLFSPLALSCDVIKFSKPFRKFPFLQYNANLQFHTSAIFAASIDTLTSQFRLKSKGINLFDLTTAMSSYSRKMISSSVCLPFPISDDAFLSSMVQKDVPEYYMTSISPFYDPKHERTLFQSAVLRGVPMSKFQKPNKSYYVEPDEQFAEYLNRYSSSSVTTATVFNDKCCVAHPFPSIFKNSVGTNGFLHSEPYSNVEGVKKVPTAASFSNSDSAAQYIDSLLDEANKINFRDYVKCSEPSYEKDDFVEVLQNLIGLRDNYQDY